MFTGIVQERGRVRSAEARDGRVRLTVASERVRAELTAGASVAVNGCCQTVAELGDDGFAVDVVPQTLRLSNLGGLAAGDEVNLERPLRAGEPLGGHLVQGHVDGVGEITAVAREGGETRLRVRAPAALSRYLLPRGSVTVDGVSLTVAAVEGDEFEVALIPTTLRETTAGGYGPGRRVNLEIDVVARYVERLLAGSGAAPAGGSR